MKFCWSALVLLTLVSVVAGNNVGVKAKITKKGLDFGLTVAVNAIKNMLKSKTFPDIPIPTYNMRGMKIKSWEKFDAVLKTDSTGVTIKVNSAKIRMTGNRKSDGSDPFELTLSKLDISASVAVKADKAGHLTLSLIECDVKMEGFTAKPESWLISFVSLFEAWTGSANLLICSSMKIAIDYYNPQLARLNVELISHGVDFLMGPPVISTDSIEFSLKDIVFYLGQGKKTNPSPTDFKLPSQNTKMVYIGISAFIINTLLADLHKSNVFRTWIFDDMVPSWILTTTTFGAYIPEISKKYPDLTIVLGIETAKEPVIKFEANKLVLEILITLTASVIHSDTTPNSQLFVLDLEASINTQLYTAAQKSPLAFTLNKIEARIKETNLKTLEVTKLNSLLDMVIKLVVFPAINAHLAKGYPIPGFSLPSDFGKIDLVNTQVECIACVNTGHLLFGTDFKWEENPSPESS